MPVQRDRLLEHMRCLGVGEWRTSPELVKEFGSTRRGVGNMLNRLLEAGLVTVRKNERAQILDWDEWEWSAVRGERVFDYWRGGAIPRPGDRVTVGGRRGIVDTAHPSAGTTERRKLTIILDPEGAT